MARRKFSGRENTMQLVSKGQHPAVIENVEKGSGKGGDRINAMVRLTGEEKTSIKNGWGLSTSPASKTTDISPLEFLMFDMRAIGVLDDIDEGEPFDMSDKEIMSRLEGAACLVAVDHREYQNNLYNDITNFMRLPDDYEEGDDDEEEDDDDEVEDDDEEDDEDEEDDDDDEDEEEEEEEEEDEEDDEPEPPKSKPKSKPKAKKKKKRSS